MFSLSFLCPRPDRGDQIFKWPIVLIFLRPLEKILRNIRSTAMNREACEAQKGKVVAERQSWAKAGPRPDQNMLEEPR